MLLGARFLLGDVRRLGGLSLILIAIELVLALTFMTYLGRAFKLKPKLITLLAVGSSICGVSAIIAAQGAIDADEEDSSTAIAAILLLGALSLFLFPLIGHLLHLSDHAYEPLDRSGCRQYGGGDRSRGPLLRRSRKRSRCWPRPAAMPQSVSSCSVTPSTGHQRGRLPWYRIRPRFYGESFPSSSSAFCLFLSSQLSASSPNHSSPRLVIFPDGPSCSLFAGVGLRTNLRELSKQGLRPFIVGAVGEIVIAIITLGLVFGADHWYHL